jgi:hypothetical protein
MAADGRAHAPFGAARPRRPAAPATERRDRVRCEVHIDIDVQRGEKSYVGLTRDLSEAGAFIATELELEVGSTVELRIHLPLDTEPWCCLAEVRWRRAPGCLSGAPVGLGLRFVQLEADARRAIQAFLLERAPLDVDD